MSSKFIFIFSLKGAKQQKNKDRCDINNRSDSRDRIAASIAVHSNIHASSRGRGAVGRGGLRGSQLTCDIPSRFQRNSYNWRDVISGRTCGDSWRIPSGRSHSRGGMDERWSVKRSVIRFAVGD